MEDEVVEPEAFEQDGLDLFGDEEPPRLVMPPDEPTPDDDLPPDPHDPGLLDGPETPDEPDGLQTDEDADEMTPPEGFESGLVEVSPSSALDRDRDDLPEPPLALYRRYRPETFDEVIGEEHVIEPLKRAIVNNRVNHAYLFSGPRGCGKTTTARILARALNCEQGPTPTPCGKCQSCQDLACGGPGSIDVIEIDAASHGGVDDARDLRERAFFAPVHSRYKIYIIDEAHMVTPQGFNALLKLVEEPPPHVKFIFATTEPEKVIGTIRSRTHHYPFRLVPPKVLVDYLDGLCVKEGIDVDHAVLPLVVRAGGGSVRDSLSVLDQLLGGAADGHVSYEQAAALLGYTPEALLDEIVDAFAAGDAHQVFATIDKVIEVGQDPRRFAEDLLRRMRDLVIISAVPDACRTGLIDVSPEQGTRLTHQVAGFGAGELTRAAEVLASGLTQMRGTTAPRLHLELMCSRILLPAADTDGRGIHARLERLERRVGVSGSVTEADRAQDHVAHAENHVARAEDHAVAQPVSPPVEPPQQSSVTRSVEQPARRPSGRPRPSRRDYQPGNQPYGQSSAVHDGPRGGAQGSQESSNGFGPEQSQQPGQQSQQSRWQEQQPGQQTSPQSQPDRVSQPAPQQTPQEQGGLGEGAVDITTLRREWPQVLDAVKEGGRVAWMVLNGYAQVLDVHGNQATLGFSNPGAQERFVNGNYPKVLHDAVVKVLGVDLTFTAVIGEPPATARPQFHQEPAAPEPPPVDSWASQPPGHESTSRGPAYQGRMSNDGEPDRHHPGRPFQDRPGDRQQGDADASDEPSNTSVDSSHPTDSAENTSAPDSTVEDQSGDVRDEVVESGPVAGAPDPASGEAADPEPDLEPAEAHVETAEDGQTHDAGQGHNTSEVSSHTTAGQESHSASHRWSERAKGSVRPLETAHHRPASDEEPPEEDSEWDDTILEESGESPVDLIMRELGGVVIDTSGDGDAAAR
ncbi:DNA polymerase III subunit gamma and tau [Cutibacterium equinum]|uniref:DNA-directed DNA polymerase n=1 Tax=Cutibacterium equinum TaxID=3016342 RepID=A0ABY7R1Y9_9ACTN|nr:DNA polymerase III subunit gamma and tau [Cutibacterium equinum]WCC80960.1 DNA polymerase III subunit gamma and tau [Cutibacterium equinum]